MLLLPPHACQALENFVTLWSEYDDGSGTIMPRHLEELLLRLDPPLGLGAYADNKDVLRCAAPPAAVRLAWLTLPCWQPLWLRSAASAASLALRA